MIFKVFISVLLITALIYAEALSERKYISAGAKRIKYICEYDGGQFDCPSHYYIQISSAFYGRKNTNTCHTDNSNMVTCSLDITSKVKAK